MMKYMIAPALVAGAFSAPAFAQDNPALFTGPRVEAVVGTDGDLTYGGLLGYDVQGGKAVFGIEGEALLSNGRDCETLMSNIQDRLCVKAGRDLYVGGRIGFALGAGTLLYGKAGYTNLRLKETYDPGTSGGTAFEASRNLDGIRVGGGIEQKIGRNAFLKGEYRYSNYERGSRKHDGVVGIGFRF
jgi:outer membrane immunogenic protein